MGAHITSPAILFAYSSVRVLIEPIFLPPSRGGQDHGEGWGPWPRNRAPPPTHRPPQTPTRARFLKNLPRLPPSTALLTFLCPTRPGSWGRLDADSRPTPTRACRKPRAGFAGRRVRHLPRPTRPASQGRLAGVRGVRRPENSVSWNRERWALSPRQAIWEMWGETDFAVVGPAPTLSHRSRCRHPHPST